MAKDNGARGFFGRLKAGLTRSSTRLSQGIAGIFTGRKLDQAMLDELEELLIAADLGPATAAKVTAEFGRARFGKDITEAEVREALAEEIAKILNVDSMGYLSVDGLYWAMEAGARDPASPQFTDHYFTGDYPTRLLDREIAEGRNEAVDRQLSFLVDA